MTRPTKPKHPPMTARAAKLLHQILDTIPDLTMPPSYIIRDAFSAGVLSFFARVRVTKCPFPHQPTDGPAARYTNYFRHAWLAGWTAGEAQDLVLRSAGKDDVAPTTPIGTPETAAAAAEYRRRH